jgi:hypothetical protein
MITIPICFGCVHFHKDKGFTCEAFPGGIPDKILLNEFDHAKPFDGDNGIQFKPIKVVSEVLDTNDEMHRHKSGLLDSKKEYNDIVTKKNETNIDYKLDDTGRGVIQIHFMGIEQQEVDTLKHVSAEASGASLDKLRMLLVGAVGQKGCHLDMRLVTTTLRVVNSNQVTSLVLPR